MVRRMLAWVHGPGYPVIAAGCAAVGIAMLQLLARSAQDEEQRAQNAAKELQEIIEKLRQERDHLAPLPSPAGDTTATEVVDTEPVAG